MTDLHQRLVDAQGLLAEAEAGWDKTHQKWRKLCEAVAAVVRERESDEEGLAEAIGRCVQEDCERAREEGRSSMEAEMAAACSAASEIPVTDPEFWKVVWAGQRHAAARSGMAEIAATQAEDALLAERAALAARAKKLGPVGGWLSEDAEGGLLYRLGLSAESDSLPGFAKRTVAVDWTDLVKLMNAFRVGRRLGNDVERSAEDARERAEIATEQLSDLRSGTHELVPRGLVDTVRAMRDQAETALTRARATVFREAAAICLAQAAVDERLPPEHFEELLCQRADAEDKVGGGG